jgi:hypothetical protein
MLFTVLVRFSAYEAVEEESQYRAREKRKKGKTYLVLCKQS